MARAHFTPALNRQVRPLQFCPGSTFDVLVRNPAIIARIGNGRRLADLSEILKLQNGVSLAELDLNFVRSQLKSNVFFYSKRWELRISHPKALIFACSITSVEKIRQFRCGITLRLCPC